MNHTGKSSMLQLVNLNNLAVEAIASGKPETAAHILQAAWRGVWMRSQNHHHCPRRDLTNEQKHALESNSADNTNNNDENYLSTTTLTEKQQGDNTTIPPRDARKRQRRGEPRQQQQQQGAGNAMHTIPVSQIDDTDRFYGFIYRRGIPIRGNGPAGWDTTCTAILLFNLSLAYHLIAAGSSFHPSCHLVVEKALRLYDLSWKLMVQQQQGTSARFCQLLGVVIPNNMGQMLYELGMHHLSRPLFLQALCCMNLGGHKFEESEWAGLLFNTTLLNNEPQMAGAA